MKRWLVLPFGLGGAAIAGYALLSPPIASDRHAGAPPRVQRSITPSVDAAPAAERVNHGLIDRESRARLEAILEQ